MAVNHQTAIYRFLRMNILAIFDCKCYVCNSVNISNHVHHLDQNSVNNEVSNLLVLCDEHHKFLHKNKLILSVNHGPEINKKLTDLNKLVKILK